MLKKIVISHLFSLVIVLFIGSCKSSEEKIISGEFTQFSVWDQNSVNHVLHIDQVNNIITSKQTIPTYVNLYRLIAEYKTNNTNLILKVNGRVQQSGRGENDFSKDVVYDLYLGDKKQKSYAVKLTKGALSNDFKTFSFSEKQLELYQPSINLETGEIKNEQEIPLNIDITSLQPTFTISEKNAVVKVNGIVQTSGVSRHNFSKPVLYTVTGEDGTSKDFTVTLKTGNHIALTNPIVTGSYADPTVIRVGNEFYLYVTSGRVRGYKSTDLVNWGRIAGSSSEVFTQRPDFTADNVSETGMWAPDINHFDGKYVMYYSISKWGGGATCGIGVGVSTKPEGPFLPPAGNPNGKLFVSSEIDVHNSIDPCFYEENGKRYLFWGSFYGIYMTELTADGMTVKDLNKKTKVAGKSFEATYIHKRGNYYYLFASVGSCCEGANSTYKVVVGRSEKLEGPYLSRSGTDMNNVDAWNPSNFDPVVIQGDDMFLGPGHNSRIITDSNGVDWMLYHSYVDKLESRNLLLGKIEWDNDGWPKMGNSKPSYIMNEIPVFK